MKDFFRSHAFGVIAILLSALSYAIMAALVKVISNSARPPSFDMILFFESLVAVLIMLSFYNVGIIEKIKTKRILIHMLRAFFGLCMVFTAWISVKSLPLADAVVLHNIAPLFLPFLAFFFLHNPIRRLLWLPIIVGFVGVVWIVNPHDMHANLPSILAAFSGLAFACVLIVSKNLVRTEPAARIIFYYFAFSTVATGIGLIWFWQDTSVQNFVIMAILGGLFLAVQALMNIGLRIISPLICSILFYSCVAYGFLIDWFYWHTQPELSQFIGLLVIVSMSIWAIYLNRPKNGKVQSKGVIGVGPH